MATLTQRLYTTREQWLEAARDEMRPWLSQQGHPLPEATAVSCGWPSTRALSDRKRRIGECWSDKCSERKTFEIFISPYLADPVDVLHVLLHELIHAAVGTKCGHKNPFRKVAIALGMIGKMTATEIGPELRPKLTALAAELNDYPHRKLDGMEKTGPKKQNTRMLKAACPDCGYTVRVARKWLEIGLPTCTQCGTVFTSDDADEDKEDN